MRHPSFILPKKKHTCIVVLGHALVIWNIAYALTDAREGRKIPRERNNMNNLWKNLTIRTVEGAAYVAADSGGVTHRNRLWHGFVLNDPVGVKEYTFSDGRVMRTEAGALFYLPKGSSYTARVIEPGGCYAINFDAQITDEPFVVHLRNQERLRHDFKVAESAWRKMDRDFCHSAAMRAVYNAIYQLLKEQKCSYVSAEGHALLRPALDVLENDFTSNHITVSYLAALCGISEVYFRRLFMNMYGVMPKEYISQRRIEYARMLLRMGTMSVAEVASRCGYGEPCHFSREFSRRVGISPSEYAMGGL